MHTKAAVILANASSNEGDRLIWEQKEGKKRTPVPNDVYSVGDLERLHEEVGHNTRSNHIGGINPQANTEERILVCKCYLVL